MNSLSQACCLACGLAIFFGLGAGQSMAAGPGDLQVPPDASFAAEWLQSSLVPAAQERVEVASVPPLPPTRSSTPGVSASRQGAMQPGPARVFTINEILAKQKQTASSSRGVKLAATSPSGPEQDAPRVTTSALSGSEPFGMFTFRAPEGPLWTKWLRTEADIETEAPALLRCLEEPDHCTPAAARIADIVKKAERQQGLSKLALVNRLVNATIRYTADTAQWRTADRWSAPLDADETGSFNTRRGDCEDYAIAKYVILKKAGFPAADLRILLVYENTVRMDHAVLAGRVDGRWHILDNRYSVLFDDNETRSLAPLYAIGDDGVKRFAARYSLISPVTDGDLTGYFGMQTIVVGSGAPNPAWSPAMSSAGPPSAD